MYYIQSFAINDKVVRKSNPNQVGTVVLIQIQADRVQVRWGREKFSWIKANSLKNITTSN